MLQKYRPGMKRIMLLVCYNIALASYLKRLLQEKGIGPGPERVQILHFSDKNLQVLTVSDKKDFYNGADG
jgi:hypothetical protein